MVETLSVAVRQQLTTLPLQRLQRRQYALALGGILALGTALRLWLLGRGIPMPDSDEGMVGLMALHMLHGEWSIFLWGQAYMGSLESMLIAPFLLIFGPHAFSLHLAPLFIGMAAIAMIAVPAAWLISRSAGLIVALLLAVGPPFFDVLGLRAFGGYVETLLFGNLLLLLALLGAYPWGRTPRMLISTGLIAGLAFWTNMLVIPFLCVMVVIFWWQRRADLISWRGLLLVACLLIGASPALIYNFTNNAATVTTVLSVAANNPQSAHLTPWLIPANVWQVLTVSLPILLGGSLGGTQSAGFTGAMLMQQAANNPVVYGGDLLLALGAVVLVIGAAIGVIRHRRELRVRVSQTTPDRATVRLHYEGALVIIAVCYVAAFSLKSDQIFGVPRYLFPLFSAAPLVVGQVERVATWLVARLPDYRSTSLAGAKIAFSGDRSWMREWLVPSRLTALLFLPVVVWNVIGVVVITPFQTAALDHGTWIAGSDAALLRVLQEHHVHTIISDSYWSGFRLSFESGEAVIPLMKNPDGTLGFNRYQPYIARAESDPRPAYLNITGTQGMEQNLRAYQSGLMPHYTMLTIGIYTVFLPPG
jgi:hypothetical protein